MHIITIYRFTVFFYWCPTVIVSSLMVFGVPIMVQWLTNPTRNHEVAGSVAALAQWVNHPVLP